MASEILNIIEWGEVPYEDAWRRQQDIFNGKIVSKQSKQLPSNDLILCSHPPVYTIGRNGNPRNLLVTEKELQARGALFYKIDRGGDITFHGPGQIVGYPIIDLEQFHWGIKTYLFNIEELIIRLLACYDIKGERFQGATGVWLEPYTARARKICAIGVRASHYVTMHGFALNVNTDLRWFSLINPCGFTDKSVTSMQQELNRPVPIEEVTGKMKLIAKEIFQTGLNI